MPADGDKREALIGHTSLCFMALLGFVIYTSSYSVIYATKTGGKPVAVTEMWMALSHLVCSLLSCIIKALSVDVKPVGSNLAKAQSAVFLGIALAVTGLGTACMQDTVYCSIYYPAAALPPLAAAGSVAWAWVMYVASLGCQTGVVGMGGSEGIAAACVVGHVVPQILFALDSTCGAKWKGYCSSALSCSTALNVTLLFAALLLSHAGSFFLDPHHGMQMPMMGAALQIFAVVTVWIDILAILSVGQSGFSGAMGVYLWSISLLTLFPISDILRRSIHHFSLDKKSRANPRGMVHPTGIRLPPLDDFLHMR